VVSSPSPKRRSIASIERELGASASSTPTRGGKIRLGHAPVNARPVSSGSPSRGERASPHRRSSLRPQSALQGSPQLATLAEIGVGMPRPHSAMGQSSSSIPRAFPGSPAAGTRPQSACSEASGMSIMSTLSSGTALDGEYTAFARPSPAGRSPDHRSLSRPQTAQGGREGRAENGWAMRGDGRDVHLDRQSQEGRPHSAKDTQRIAKPGRLHAGSYNPNPGGPQYESKREAERICEDL